MNDKSFLKFLLIVIITLTFFNAGAQNVQNVNDIEITGFDLKLTDNKIMINWSTGDDDMFNYFEIEKSDNGKDFKTFAYVLGADPLKGENRFGYFDRLNKKSGTLYYRIRHIDDQGRSQYSDIKSISLL